MDTIVAVLLDASGSMERHANTAIRAVNSYVDELRGSTSMEFCLRQFSSTPHGGMKQHVSYWLTPLDRVTPMSRAQYLVGGSTPLYDAVLQTIRDLEAIAKIGQRVVLVIQTDGEENASKANISEVRGAIERVTAKGWAITFLGTGIDSWVGQDMGMSALNTISTRSAADIEAGMKFAARATRSYATGDVVGTAMYSNTKSNDTVKVG